LRLLYFHGFASGPTSGKAQYFKRRFAECGVTLEIPNLVEGNFEDLTITGQLQVIERVARGEPVALMGSSMGGYLAALYASSHVEVTKLVLMAPAFNFPQRWPAELGPEKSREWRETGRLEVFHYAENRNAHVGWQLIEDAVKYDPAPNFAQPALIFHGTEDTVVPAAYSRDFAATHPKVVLRLLKSDHQLTDVLDLMWSEVKEFLILNEDKKG
jgi:pimeloyl-ACP methyl ester carboxylesterase